MMYVFKFRSSDGDDDDAPPRREHVALRRVERCKVCCKQFSAFMFSRVGLCLLVVAYAIMGGFAFQALEAPEEQAVRHQVADFRDEAVRNIWEYTVETNVFHQVNWTKMAEAELIDFQKKLIDAVQKGYSGKDGDGGVMWSYPGAVLYAITIITTIGYGHITCKTSWGKVVTMAYAIVGIPMMLLCLANIGSSMADSFRFLYARVCCLYCNMVRRNRRRGGVKQPSASSKVTSPQLVSPKHTPTGEQPAMDADAQADNLECGEQAANVCNAETSSGDKAPEVEVVVATDEEGDEVDLRKVTVPISLTLLVLSLYIMLGAMLFSLWENWDYLDGAYFCFVTVSTIGLGDFVPGNSIDSTGSEAQGKLVLCSMYLLFGLAIMCMGFNLMQEEVRAKFQRVALKLGLMDEEEPQPVPV